MPNFDALRTSLSGPLAYICRPKEKPVDLLGCWSLGDGITTDLSRYPGYVNFNFAPAFTDSYGFPLATVVGGQKSSSFVLGKTLDCSKDWSVEGYFRDASGRPDSWLTVAGLDFVAGDGKTGDSGDGASIWNGSTRLTNGGSWRNPKGLIHRAVQYTASNTTLRVYKNGTPQVTLVRDLTGITSAMVVYYFSGNGFGDGDNTWGISNFRAVQKALGTATAYPTPSGLFTGFEAL